MTDGERKARLTEPLSGGLEQYPQDNGLTYVCLMVHVVMHENDGSLG